jgi:hypothetical protein
MCIFKTTSLWRKKSEEVNEILPGEGRELHVACVGLGVGGQDLRRQVVPRGEKQEEERGAWTISPELCLSRGLVLFRGERGQASMRNSFSTLGNYWQKSSSAKSVHCRCRDGSDAGGCRSAGSMPTRGPSSRIWRGGVGVMSGQG